MTASSFASSVHVLVVIAASGITYLVTRDRRWLRFGGSSSNIQ
jgi:hypothetical protein